MMPKYKSIKESLPWAIGESPPCLQQEEFCVLSIQNHFAVILGEVYILYLIFVYNFYYKIITATKRPKDDLSDNGVNYNPLFPFDKSQTT